MNRNYLFIKGNEQNLDLSNLDFSDIHLWNISHILNKQKHQTVYFYCKNLTEFHSVVHSCYIPHITFLGDSLFSEFYENTLTKEFDCLERFWFPDLKHLTEDTIKKFLSLKDINTTSIAIAFNPFIQKDISYVEFIQFIKKLYTVYKNPLFTKELLLQENELFSLNNKAIINGKTYYVVLGLFGDYYLLNSPTEQSLSLGIFKDPNCITCEFAHTCKERGLGIIKTEEQLKSCIGIKLFQQN